MIDYFSLEQQNKILGDELIATIMRVINSGHYILGDEVKQFEEEFKNYCGASYCVGVANGTDALVLSMVALGVKPGDEVITVPNTAMPTVSAISIVGATPVFVDVDDSYCIRSEE